MNAVAAFENRKDTLREQLEASENMPQAISAATMALEQIACDLAQDEQDDFARQRQQAVMALAKRLPMSLRAGRARAQIVLEETEEQPSTVRRGAVGAGAIVLAALAVYEAVGGKLTFALLQALGVGMAGDAEQAAGALVQPVDGVIIKRRRILTEQDGKLFAERAGVDVAAGERSQRRALADDDHILVDVADEGRRQAVQTAVGRRGLHPAVVHADFKQLTCAQNRVRAKGLAVAENAALDFEPPKRVRAQLKTPGNDASRRAACVFLGGDIG